MLPTVGAQAKRGHERSAELQIGTKVLLHSWDI